MKSIKSIAAVIIERRNRMSHIILPGDMQSMIGSDGVQEALRRGWIEPDYDTGALKVSSNLAIVEEIARIAECDCETCGKKECECDKEQQESLATANGPRPSDLGPGTSDSGPRNYALRHSTRLTEFAAPGSGQPERPVAPQAPQAQPNAASNRTEDHTVGEDVVVAEEGKSYQAKVKARNQDGTYELSFGQNRPVQVRHYRKEEIQRVAPGDLQLVK